MRTLKSKFVVIILLIIMVILSISGYLLIKQKTEELTEDIYRNALSFSRLTADPIMDSFSLNYVSQGFSFFRRDILNQFKLNPDIDQIQIMHKAGFVSYDSELERDAQYEGDTRIIKDSELLQRIKANLISAKLKSGRVIYLEEDSGGNTHTLNANGEPVATISRGERIENIVLPYSDHKHSLVYDVSYALLSARIWNTIIDILILTSVLGVFGIIIAMLMATFIVKPLKELTRGSEKFAHGDLAYRVHVQSRDEIGALAISFNQMAEDLEKSTQELLIKERLTTEFQIAAKIQDRLIPQKLPMIEGFDISANVNSASEMGGDIYDFISESESSMFLYLADVTGHGVPAGIIASLINALNYNYSLEHPDLVETANKLNQVVHAKTDANMFATMVFGRLKSPNIFTAVNAGHEPILHYHAKTKEFEEIRLGGMAVGMIPDFSKLIKEKDIKMETGDLIFLYTDGVVEAWKNDKETLNMDGFQKIISSIDLTQTAHEIETEIIKQIRTYMGDYEQKDDITLLTIKKI